MDEESNAQHQRRRAAPSAACCCYAASWLMQPLVVHVQPEEAIRRPAYEQLSECLAKIVKTAHDASVSQVHGTMSGEHQAAGVTKSSRILNAAEEPLSTRTSSTYRIASRRAGSRLSSSGLA